MDIYTYDTIPYSSATDGIIVNTPSKLSVVAAARQHRVADGLAAGHLAGYNPAGW